MSHAENLRRVGQGWAAARRHERDVAQTAYALMRDAAADGIPETHIAELVGVDRMTVRRALGKN
jgi:DNA invertase Pin-like site-specific DNA recombinase